jgi:uncharacterized protein (TIGR02284 family)
MTQEVAMSTDESVTKEILETLEDGSAGFNKGAEKLEEIGEGSLAGTFRTFGDQRRRFADELQGMANAYGDDPDRSGSIVAALHRGWMSLKDALTKDTPEAILEVASQGEDHAVTEYEKALQDDISPGLRTVLERQLIDVRAARDTVAALASKS